MNESRHLKRSAEAFLRSYARLYPVRATSLGIHDHDDLLGDYTREGIAEKLHVANRLIDELKSIDEIRLEARDRIDYRLLRSHCELAAREITSLSVHTRNPCMYLTEGLKGITSLLNDDLAPLEDRVGSIISRMSRMPQFLATAASNLLHPPELWTRMAIRQCRETIGFLHRAAPQFVNLARGHKPLMLDAHAHALAGCRTYLRTLQNDLLPRSTGTFSIGPEELEFYTRRVHFLEESVEELEEIGRSTFSDLKGEISEEARRLYPGKSWVEALLALKSEHPGPEELLHAYHREVKRARRFVEEKDLVTIPRDDRLVIIPTPPYERDVTPTTGYAGPAAFEHGRPGYLLVTPVETNWPETRKRERLREHSYSDIALSAVHEAYPGHHLQFLLARRASSAVAKLSNSTLFSEGWALYCEDMMSEQGYFPEKVQFHKLVNRLFRAGRVTMDILLQTGRMTFDDAVEFLTGEIRMERTAAVADVQWYTMEPSSPLAYLLGRREIQKLLDGYRKIHEGRMCLKTFHDTLLSHGSIPPKLIALALL